MLLSRIGSGQNVQTLLVYNYSRYDSLLGVYLNEFGLGMIPNEDFKAPGIKITKHVLDTDTTNNPNIEATTSSFDPNTGESIVLPTNRGRINFEFENNRQFSVSQNGSSVTKTAGFAITIRTHGSSESATAGFKGSFFGTAIESRSGASIGTNHQTTLILER